MRFKPEEALKEMNDGIERMQQRQARVKGGQSTSKRKSLAGKWRGVSFLRDGNCEKKWDGLLTKFLKDADDSEETAKLLCDLILKMLQLAPWQLTYSNRLMLIMNACKEDAVKEFDEESCDIEGKNLENYYGGYE